MFCALLSCDCGDVAALPHVVQDRVSLEVVDDHDGVVLLDDAAVIQVELVGLERRRRGVKSCTILHRFCAGCSCGNCLSLSLENKPNLILVSPTFSLKPGYA